MQLCAHTSAMKRTNPCMSTTSYSRRDCCNWCFIYMCVCVCACVCVCVYVLSVHLVQAVKVEDHALSLPVGFSSSCCSCCATIKHELCFLRHTTATAQYTVRQHACTKLLAQTCPYMHARSVTARSLHNCIDVTSKECTQWCSQQHDCACCAHDAALA
jgi:hypothetical protein